MELDELCNLYPRGHPRLENELNQLKRKLGADDQLFNSSDDDDLCAELNSVERKCKKLKSNDNFLCDVCGQQLKHRQSLDNHLESHFSTFRCRCGKTFKCKRNLYTHRKRCFYRETTFTCNQCNNTFQTNRDLQSHVHATHSQQGGRAPTAAEDVSSQNQPSTSKADDEYKNSPHDEERRFALNGTVQDITIRPRNDTEKFDLLRFYSALKSKLMAILLENKNRFGNIKFYLNTRVRMVRQRDGGEEESTVPHFRSTTFQVLDSEDLDHFLNQAFQQMQNAMEEFIHHGSNWRMESVLGLEIKAVPYQPLTAAKYRPLPAGIQQLRGIVNIQNNDEKCFLWCVLAALHPTNHNPQRVSHYHPFENELNVNGISFPTPISQIKKFEDQNGISINVFGFEKEFFPLYISPLDHSTTKIDLLYVQGDGNSHYYLIKDLNRVLGFTKRCKNKHYFCRRCLHGFIREDLLNGHKPYCQQFDCQKVEYPTEGKDNILKFTNFHKKLRVPFVIYCDFETLVQKMDTCSPSPEASSTTHEAHFNPCGYAYQVICTNSKYTKPPVVHRGQTGENVVEHFLNSLLREEEYIKGVLSDNEPLRMTKETEIKFRNSTQCHICEQPFNEKTKKVRDHYHIGVEGNPDSPEYSNFRGAACNSCNFNFQEPKFIPVIFHNLKGFDGHLLCQHIGKLKDKRLKVIAQNMERYVSFSVGDLRFIDSFQFMTSSLETLVRNLACEGLSYFKHFTNVFSDVETAKFVLRKNVYCYDYIDNYERFEETNLPSKEAFYNRLKKVGISEEDYAYVQEVWRRFDMKNLGDLHDHYVLTDVLLLADVFERFRDMTLDYYKLDACHYFTSPGLAWDAALKMTGISLDLITDPLMYNFFELGLRGGVSMISKKFSAANHPEFENYDPSKPIKNLIYLDANNLYGGVMRFPLPIGFMRWLENEEIKNFNIATIPINGRCGYTLEVDLEYPQELHDDHNCYPLAPEHKIVHDEELSPYSQQLWEELHAADGLTMRRRGKTSKLIPTLEDKKHYVLHYRNLQLYLSLGMKISHVHQVLEYKQEPWLMNYIDFNSKKRQNAKNNFEKDFFKLMNNAVFGKTMENLRNRVNIKLVHTEKKLKKLCAKPSFDRLKIFNEDLVGVENKKVKLLLNKPVYIGQTILDLSKLVMYDFHYNFMKKMYGDQIRLLFTDTDSLMYEIETPDLDGDLAKCRDLFDLSNYPPNHPLHDNSNKKVVLKFKNETAGKL